MQPPQQPPSPPFEIHASGKTTQEKRPSSIGFREGSDDTVSEISDGNEWFYETMCSKFDEDAIPSTIQEYRSRATSQRKAKARAKTSRPATAAAAAHQVAEPANVDDLMAENIQLKEINKSVWRELQSLRQRSQKVNDDAERTRRHVRSAAGSIESLQEQLATSLSLVDALEKEKEDHGRQIDDLQTMVSDLTEKLAATISELNATKEQLQRKERKVDMLENSIRVSSRDLDRTRRSLREKVRKNICMELEIETLHEDLNEERTSHAGSSSNNSDPSNRSASRISGPGAGIHRQRPATPLEAKISSGRRIGDTATTAGTGASIPTSLLEAKLADIVEELDTVKATSAQEKLNLEERHRSQLKKVVDEHDAEKDDLLRQMNALEKMVLNSEVHQPPTPTAASSGILRRGSRRPRTTPQASASDTALTSSTKNIRGIPLKNSASLSQRRRRPSHDANNPYLQAFGGSTATDDRRRSSTFSLEPKSLEEADDYYRSASPPSSLQDANRSSKSNTSRNPQQDSSSTCDVNSLAEISEQVRQRAMAA